MISNKAVKTRTAKPLIGAINKVRTPGLNAIPLVVASPEPTP